MRHSISNLPISLWALAIWPYLAHPATSIRFPGVQTKSRMQAASPTA